MCGELRGWDWTRVAGRVYSPSDVSVILQRAESVSEIRFKIRRAELERMDSSHWSRVWSN